MAVEEAEARHSEIVGNVAQGRLGFGRVTRSQWSKAKCRKRFAEWRKNPGSPKLLPYGSRENG
jgi:hypothetical protein